MQLPAFPAKIIVLPRRREDVFFDYSHKATPSWFVAHVTKIIHNNRYSLVCHEHRRRGIAIKKITHQCLPAFPAKIIVLPGRREDVFFDYSHKATPSWFVAHVTKIIHNNRYSLVCHEHRRRGIAIKKITHQCLPAFPAKIIVLPGRREDVFFDYSHKATPSWFVAHVTKIIHNNRYSLVCHEHRRRGIAIKKITHQCLPAFPAKIIVLPGRREDVFFDYSHKATPSWFVAHVTKIIHNNRYSLVCHEHRRRGIAIKKITHQCLPGQNNCMAGKTGRRFN